MKDFKLTASSIGVFIQELWKLDLSKSYRVNLVAWRENRSLSQNAFQHAIYNDISKYLISKGRVDWCPKKTKRELKSSYLGWELEEYTNLSTGETILKDALRSTSKLDVGDSYQYTTQILDFAQSIGCSIKIPSKCEYRDLMEVQNT